jgi:hypothetical protein
MNKLSFWKNLFSMQHYAWQQKRSRRGAKFVIENLMATPKRKVAFFEAPDGMQVELMEDLP